MKANIYFVCFAGFILEWEIFHTKIAEKSKHILYIQNICSENRAFCQKMQKNIVQPDRPQLTIKYGTDKNGFSWQINGVFIQIHIS